MNYARGSVNLAGFSLSASEDAHAQRFINEKIDLTEFVKSRDVLAHPKISHNEKVLAGRS